MNCRGTMFCGDVLVSLPPPKFFNFHEGSVDHVTGKVMGDLMEKMDGSLISTYLHKDSLYLKSKGHIFSEQAVRANKLLKSKYPALAGELYKLTKAGYTVNMEYTAPDNVIVVFYPETSLTVLSIRRMSDGHMFFGSSIVSEFADYPEVQKNLVRFRAADTTDINAHVAKVMLATEGEGEVIELKSGSESYLVKVKNDRYTLLHHTKNDIDSPRKLLECVLEQKTDDLKSLFRENPEIITFINNFEASVVPIINQVKTEVENYYAANSQLDKKTYFMSGDLGPKMNLAMELYIGRKPDYNHFIMKNKKTLFPHLQFSDESVVKKLQNK